MAYENFLNAICHSVYKILLFFFDTKTVQHFFIEICSLFLFS